MIKMKIHDIGIRTKLSFVLMFPIIFFLFSTAVMGHGGKGHETGDFTAFKALEEAVKLYDKLISARKLAESWETDLVDVNISIREKGGNREFAVSFHCSKGDPDTVYIFFTDTGEYAGSNFTGE